VTRDPVIDALVEGFAAEARTICQRMTGHVLALEHAAELDEELRRKHYEDLARGLHTLKGNSDTFGFPELADLAHKMEDVVQRHRPTLATLPASTTDLLLRATDVFVARTAARGDDAAALPPIVDLLAELVRAAATPPSQPLPRIPTPTRAPKNVIAPKTVPARDDAADDKPKPARTTARVRSGTSPATDPDATAAARIDDWRVGPQHVDALLREIERLRELRQRIDEKRRDVDRAVSALQRGRTPDLAELRDLLQSVTRSLDVDGHEAGDIIDTLEQELKAIVTLPVRWILDPLQRAVRDLCRSVGKQARLSCVGAEIALDRRLLEALNGALVHLVRNAIDHGIEEPAARAAAGKHVEGAITIRVERTGNLVVIHVEDDGGGLDLERIRAAAVARGMMAAEHAAIADERELHELLFRTGFSTRTAVSELSGRGVGLDVVREVVAGLDGHVEVHTTRGSSTRFTLTVPATLGSTPILVVHADEQVLGVPMVAVETIRAVRSDDVALARGSSRLDHAGELVPLVDLAVLLGLRAPQPVAAGQVVLVLYARGERVALTVDGLVGDRDLVVRPLPAELHALRAYQGAATQARGDLLLVLQPDFLIDGRTAVAVAHSPMPRALVVDDSLTARALHRTMLESGGYRVHTVGSARQALDHLRATHYDVVIADIVMAEIDGIELTTMLRARRDTRTLPVILVSSHDSDAERERGMAAGADAFLSKKECVSGRLLAEVGSVIARRERSR
jgi:chemotaxis protein histidine kinase CheA